MNTFTNLKDLDLEEIGILAEAAAAHWGEEHPGAARYVLDLAAGAQAELCSRQVDFESFTEDDWGQVIGFGRVQRDDQDRWPEEARDFWAEELGRLSDERHRPEKERRQLEDLMVLAEPIRDEDDEEGNKH